MLYSLRRWVILLSLVVCWAAFVHCEDVVADKQSDVAAEKQSEAVADKTLTWNSAVAASNFNQFKTNLDRKFLGSQKRILTLKVILIERSL